MDNKQDNLTIRKVSTTYAVGLPYYSERKGEENEAEIIAIEEADGTITMKPGNMHAWADEFVFKHSDPDRLIAVAKLLQGFAQAIKSKDVKPIDTHANS